MQTQAASTRSAGRLRWRERALNLIRPGGWGVPESAAVVHKAALAEAHRLAGHRDPRHVHGLCQSRVVTIVVPVMESSLDPSG
jgi:hypothetical protein